MPIKVRHAGNFNKIEKLFANVTGSKYLADGAKAGAAGVEALRAATPKRTGKTANSWRYEVDTSRSRTSVSWINDNVNNGENVALLIQYGHGTGTGGYVRGTDYINPAIQPIVENMANETWKEVTSK